MHLRQHLAHLADETDHRRAGRTRTIQHPIQHVFHVPAEFAQGLGTHQAAAALEGMEHATDRAQQLAIIRAPAPSRQQFAQIDDFLLEFLEEDLADLVVDFFPGAFEAGAQRRRIALHRNHLHRCGDLIHRRQGRCRCKRGGFGLGNIRGDLVPGAFRQRPVSQCLQAVTGLVEQVLPLAVRVAQGLQVVLHAGQGIGQRVEFASARHLALADQLRLAVAAQGFEVARRFFQLQDPHRTGHFAKQARHRFQRSMVPIGFDEGHERVAHFRKIGGRFARQHRHHLARFLLDQVVAVGGAGIVMAEPGDLVVQRMVDVDQRTRHVQQVVLVSWAFATRHPLHDLALLLDDATGGLQAEHAEGFTDPVQRLRLRLQAGHIGQACTQVQVQCVLDPQQVFLERRRDGIEQGAIASRQAAARMLQFRFAGFEQQVRQRILLHQGHATRAAQVVEQRQQHDRDVAMPALQTFQIIGQLDHAAHQRRAGIVAAGHAVRSQCFGQLLHLPGHHRRCLQL